VISKNLAFNLIIMLDYILFYLLVFRFKDEKSIDFYKIRMEDDEDESIQEYLEQACNFIGKFLKKIIMKFQYFYIKKKFQM